MQCTRKRSQLRSVLFFLLGSLIGHVLLRGSKFHKHGSTNKLKILCYILTHPTRHDQRAIHVQNTWARRCDKVVFASTAKHPKLEVLSLKMTRVDIYNHLWLKTQAAIKAIHHSASDYDFFFKADDDTFAVLPNMRKLLATHSSKEPVMFGKLIPDYCQPGFLSGGAGYVLSHESLRRIVEEGLDKHPACSTEEADMEDVRICRCARALGINMVEPRGRSQRPLFFHLFPKWIYGNSVNQIFNSPNISTSYEERLHVSESWR
ncbi:hypothetical protein CRM22_009387 [Opisthorchis felineus]|uniref:N-acetylgalactosaminide beta-1,3-galactosyltransferase n=1 Tax=Opisthorchis felineus TaxID=147828 RepID=A0A4S2L7T9_OPIFE|nr:hypothetical protein CRM22_009387 [Opisthorchis felineus]